MHWLFPSRFRPPNPLYVTVRGRGAPTPITAEYNAVTCARRAAKMSVLIETSLGEIVVDLWVDHAPLATKSNMAGSSF